MLFYAPACIFIQVVREGDILARWTFDGEGMEVWQPMLPEEDLLLEGGAKWGLESNNTAISKYSLDIREGIKMHGSILARRNLGTR